MAQGTSTRPADLVRVAGDLRLSLSFLGATPTLRLEGSAPCDPEQTLAPPLREVHERLVEAGAAQLVVELDGLRFVPPSALTAFERWFDDVRALPRGRRYRLLLRWHAEHGWQRTTVRVLLGRGGELVDLLA